MGKKKTSLKTHNNKKAYTHKKDNNNNNNKKQTNKQKKEEAKKKHPSVNTTLSSVSKAADEPEPSSSIASIHSRPVKFLGRIIDGSFSD